MDEAEGDFDDGRQQPRSGSDDGKREGEERHRHGAADAAGSERNGEAEEKGDGSKVRGAIDEDEGGRAIKRPAGFARQPAHPHQFADAAGHRDRPGRRLALSRDEAQQRGLAGAIATNESDALRSHSERKVFKQHTAFGRRGRYAIKRDERGFAGYRHEDTEGSVGNNAGCGRGF